MPVRIREALHVFIFVSVVSFVPLAIAKKLGFVSRLYPTGPALSWPELLKELPDVLTTALLLGAVFGVFALFTRTNNKRQT
jgi:hypothetical protein